MLRPRKPDVANARTDDTHRRGTLGYNARMGVRLLDRASRSGTRLLPAVRNAHASTDRRARPKHPIRQGIPMHIFASIAAPERER
ncbi:hypothetical protein BTJ49_02795 [Oleiagrimonas sp. MCCC 1A03011]|nr:hypothetical protein BTJ49_02795 [Oleiagrimonas sp. MCCC 1A03011]